ncbi:MAG: hypothetical protein ACFWUC_00725 [Oscillospiraceae bacterium]|jgi:precorrin-2 dehydrogenase / sirohydrochlorin ferrochelatase
MAYFPLFIDLSAKNVLVVGGGAVAERKITSLLEFDAAIRVVSPIATQKIHQLSKSCAITWLSREYRSDDVQGCTIVIAATGSKEINRCVYQDAVRNSVPVNVVDDPELCTFYFPSIVRRKDFVAGMTTSGSYPAFSKYARRKIEQLFPDPYGNLLKVLKEYRKRVRTEIREPELRKTILEELLQTGITAVESGMDSQHLTAQLDKVILAKQKSVHQKEV